MNISFEQYSTKVNCTIDEDSTTNDVLRSVIGLMITLGYRQEGILSAMEELVYELKPIEK